MSLFPMQHCLLQSVVQKWRCVVRTRLTFSRSVMVMVAVSSLGHTDLFFIDQGTKVNGIEMFCFINSFCQPFATCLATSLLFNRTTPCRQGTWDRAAVNLWNTRLHCSSSVASQQSWPEPGRLPDVVGKHRSRMHDVDQLKSCLIEEWKHFQQVFIDEAIRQEMRACIQAHGGHFEHKALVMFDICTDVHFDSHMSIRLPIVDSCFEGLTKPVITIAICKCWDFT